MDNADLTATARGNVDAKTVGMVKIAVFYSNKLATTIETTTKVTINKTIEKYIRISFAINRWFSGLRRSGMLFESYMQE